jgi:transposase-like protein
MKFMSERTKCKLCGSEKVIRFGIYHGIQRWWCKECCHKFADNNAVPNMKTPACQVSTALEMYFAGIPLNKIPGLIFHRYGAYITRTSVFQWVSHFSRCALDEAGKSNISVSDVWVADNLILKNGLTQEGLRIVDIIDLETRFLLATEISFDLGRDDIQVPVRSSVDKAGKVPLAILVDVSEGWRPDSGIITRPDSRAVRTIPIEPGGQNGFIVNWRRRVNSRNKILKGLKKKERLNLIRDGWSMHYNYFCAQEELSGDTPAGAAQSGYNLRNWSDVVYHASPGCFSDASTRSSESIATVNQNLF